MLAKSSLVALLLAGLLGPGCGKDPVGPKPSDITGTWTATKIEYISKADGTTVDAVPLGGSITLVLSADRSSTYTARLPGGSPQVLQGTWRISEDQLEFVPAAGGEIAWHVTHSGNTMRLTGADAAYDFDGDGTVEPARQNLDMRR